MGEGGRREKGSFISLPHPYPRVESSLTGYIIVYVFALDIKSPVSPTKCSANVPLRYTFPFFGKWNWSVQMLNAISGQNLPVLNFAYHLPKPWTNWYANLDSKQPKFFFYLSYTVLYFYKNNSSSRILSSISLFQACRRALWTPLPSFFFLCLPVVNFRPRSTIWTPGTQWLSSTRIVWAAFICLFSILKNPQLESAVQPPFAVSVTLELCCRLPPEASHVNNRAGEITQ